jgi:hypothetical protein
MGFALIGFGLLLTIAGARDTQGDLFALLQGDFTGSGSFLYWVAAIAFVGGLGYAKTLRPISHAFLGLIFVVFIFAENKNGRNIFAELSTALNTPANGATVSNQSSNSAPSVLNSLSGIAGSGSLVQ